MAHEIHLSHGKIAIIDDEDAEDISQHSWRAGMFCSRWYACRTKDCRVYFMHAHICGTPKGMQTDHINGDGLDNRRMNLRIVTASQNQANRRTKREYKGVYWAKHARSYVAKIGFNKKILYLGYYKTPEDAAKAYDAKGRELFGEYFLGNIHA